MSVTTMNAARRDGVAPQMAPQTGIAGMAAVAQHNGAVNDATRESVVSSMVALAWTMAPKTFARKPENAASTLGFYAGGKVYDALGGHYQASVQLYLDGSKNDPEATLTVTADQVVAAVLPLLNGLRPKTFSSGKSGWHANGKVHVAGQNFTVNILATRLV